MSVINFINNRTVYMPYYKVITIICISPPFLRMLQKLLPENWQKPLKKASLLWTR